MEGLRKLNWSVCWVVVFSHLDLLALPSLLLLLLLLCHFARPRLLVHVNPLCSVRRSSVSPLQLDLMEWPVLRLGRSQSQGTGARLVNVFDKSRLHPKAQHYLRSIFRGLVLCP